MSEPTTTLTDAALAALTLVLGAHLAWMAQALAEPALWLWAFGFLAASAASALGAVSHGYGPRMAPRASVRLWRVTLVAAGTSSAALPLSVAATYLPTHLLWITGLVVASIWLALVAAVAIQPRYLWVNIVSAVAILATTGILIAASLGGPAPGVPWLLAGVLVATLGGGVQAAGWTPAARFNHNDVYHVLLAVSFCLLYRGAVVSYAS